MHGSINVIVMYGKGEKWEKVYDPRGRRLMWFAVDEADGRAEGSWDEVMRLIGQAHVMLHDQGILRIQTDIRVGSR